MNMMSRMEAHANAVTTAEDAVVRLSHEFEQAEQELNAADARGADCALEEEQRNCAAMALITTGATTIEGVYAKARALHEAMRDDGCFAPELASSLVRDLAALCRAPGTSA